MLKRITLMIVAATLVAGCTMQSKQPPLSRRGEVVAQGTGPLSFRAPERGLVSVYDVATNTVIHSSGVSPGSVLMVNTTTGNIAVSDPGGGTQTVYQGLNKSHRYEIWFIPAQGGTARASY
ncbi:MAG: hypothetical protein QOE14_503 [Humisphaera sp.]|nr:hypothetical protein [Humisphaera sp.]